jgi:hypothetical protein
MIFGGIDPHWFDSLDTDPDLDPQWGKKLDSDPDPHLNHCGPETLGKNYTSTLTFQSALPLSHLYKNYALANFLVLLHLSGLPLSKAPSHLNSFFTVLPKLEITLLFYKKLWCFRSFYSFKQFICTRNKLYWLFLRSVLDPLHFGTDSDPWIRMQYLFTDPEMDPAPVRIQILFFSSVKKILLSVASFTSVFKDNKSLRTH